MKQTVSAQEPALPSTLQTLIQARHTPSAPGLAKKAIFILQAGRARPDLSQRCWAGVVSPQQRARAPRENASGSLELGRAILSEKQSRE